ncbi:MAG TPA: ATP-binding protein [Bryobacteraceae bacterium]|nr:ATP-binding protein [Bryobacteraceae bacterium]
MIWRATRLLACFLAVALVTWIAYSRIPVNATTVGFAYLLLVLLIATTWGFFEASLASILATLTFNFFFLPPVGKLTIADPQNWVALFSFLTTALVASRLSAVAKRRALDAVARREDIERLYTFSRSILLTDKGEPFPKQLVGKLADIFQLAAAVLYERQSEEFYRAGPADFEGLDEQLRDAALHGTSFANAEGNRTITAVRLGAHPIAALALQGSRMPDSVLQGIANLVAIGLERARAQDLAAQVEAARQSEKLRTTLLDALAHEFKTPLTSVLGATSALLDDPDQPLPARTELLKIADEEAHHLRELVDDTVEMGRLDTTGIRVQAEPADLKEVIHEVVASIRPGLDDRPLQVVCPEHLPPIAMDRRLVKLAIKQLLDNARKYSPASQPVLVQVQNGGDCLTVAVTDRGAGIPATEQNRIFERLYRSPSVADRIPGSGLGLSIALNIARAHHGDLTLATRPGETTFRLTLPINAKGAAE